jgi:hypothetical protein
MSAAASGRGACVHFSDAFHQHLQARDSTRTDKLSANSAPRNRSCSDSAA